MNLNLNFSVQYLLGHKANLVREMVKYVQEIPICFYKTNCFEVG